MKKKPKVIEMPYIEEGEEEILMPGAEEEPEEIEEPEEEDLPELPALPAPKAKPKKNTLRPTKKEGKKYIEVPYYLRESDLLPLVHENNQLLKVMYKMFKEIREEE